MKSRLRTLTIVSLVGVCAVSLASCSGGGDDDGGSGTGLVPETAVVVQANQYSGSTTTTFQLAAVVEGASNPGQYSYSWNLGPAGTATGASATAIFPAAGTYLVEVSAQNGSGAVLDGAILLTVLDATQSFGVFGEMLPPLPGDVDDDGQIELEDALRIYQQVEGARPLAVTTSPGGPAFSEWQLGDVDLDGAVTERDGELVASAVLAGQSVPSAVIPSSAAPGAVVRIFSPAFLDTSARVEVRFGSSMSFEPVRQVRGQVSAFVPLDVLTPGSYTSVGAATTIEVLLDGNPADSIPFVVLDAPDLPAGGIQDLQSVISACSAERATASAAITTFFGTAEAQTFGYSPQQAAALLELFSQVGTQLDSLESALMADLASLTPEQQEAVLRLVAANGLEEAIQTVFPASNLVEGSFLGGGGIAALCAVKDSQDRLDSLSETTGYACTALAALALVALAEPTPFGELLSAPFLLSLSAQCARLLALQETAAFVLDFLPTPGDALRLEAQGSTQVEPGESVSVVPKILVSNFSALCASDLTGGVDENLEERLAEPITEALLRRAPLRQIHQAARRLSPGIAEQLEEAVEDAVGLAIGQTLGMVLESAIDAFCNAIAGLAGPWIPVDPTLVQVTAMPSSPALSVSVAGGDIVLTCPPSMPGMSSETTYTVAGELSLCSEPIRGSLSVTCGATVEVTITMGDNGSLLDDIFQVSVDGQVVLVTSVPVTAAATTIPLSPGPHTVSMLGLAAPDGIGTYYINVSPGMLTNGPPTSGSNLTAGTKFTWTLIVP